MGEDDYLKFKNITSKGLALRNGEIVIVGSVNYMDYVSNTGNDIFLVNIGLENSTMWHHKVFYNHGDDGAQAVTIDKDQNVIFSGYFNDSLALDQAILTTDTNNQEIFISKLDNLGNVLWAKSAGGDGQDDVLAIDVDNAGNSYLMGYTTGAALFDTLVTPTQAGQQALFVAKYDAIGQAQWVKTGNGLQGFNFEKGKLAVDSVGNILVIGNFENTFTFNNTTNYSISAEGNNKAAFFTKYAQDGTLIQAQRIAYSSESLSATSLAIDGNNNVMIAGNFSGTAIFSSTQTLVSNGGSDIFFAKYDTNGNLISLKQQGTQTDEFVYDIATDGQGRYTYTGQFSGATTLEGKEFSSDNSDADCYLVSFSDIDTTANTANPIESRSSLIDNQIIKQQIKIYPNPFKDILYIEYTSAQEGEVQVEMLNAIGSRTLSQKFSVVKGANTLSLETKSNVALGVYYLKLTDNKGNFSIHKVVH